MQTLFGILIELNFGICISIQLFTFFQKNRMNRLTSASLNHSAMGVIPTEISFKGGHH